MHLHGRNLFLKQTPKLGLTAILQPCSLALYNSVIPNFSSEGKGPFMASKAKNMHHRGVISGGGRGGGGSKVRDMILELRSLKCHSLTLRPILHKLAIVNLHNNLKRLIPIILFFLQSSLSKMHGP